MLSKKKKKGSSCYWMLQAASLSRKALSKICIQHPPLPGGKKQNDLFLDLKGFGNGLNADSFGLANTGHSQRNKSRALVSSSEYLQHVRLLKFGIATLGTHSLMSTLDNHTLFACSAFPLTFSSAFVKHVDDHIHT